MSGFNMYLQYVIKQEGSAFTARTVAACGYG
jgi:hypothetical protein